MLFREALNAPCGLRYMYETLGLQSAAGRRLLLESKMMTSEAEIAGHYGKSHEFFEKVDATSANTLQIKLARLRDIRTTVVNLAAGALLDDVELFEVKNLLLLAIEVREFFIASGITSVSVSETCLPALGILDPEGQRVPSFHVYDSYSPELAEVRAQMRRAAESGAGISGQAECGGKNSAHGKAETTEEEYNRLLLREQELENQTRKHLSAELGKYNDVIRQTLEALAEADILLAQSLQMREMGLIFPEIAGNCSEPELPSDRKENEAQTFDRDTHKPHIILAGRKTKYEKMFHPQVRDRLRGKGVEFQPVDISFGGVPITIIGANMGGKTVVLKTVGLCQLLFQFGFGIPANRAEIDVKSEVCFCIGDEDLSDKGFSAFASEVVCLNGIIAAARAGGHILALVDEPARTTNPVEGTALVEAFIKTMEGTQADLLVTTHYNLKNIPGRRYRVRGLESGRMNYLLEETTESAVPHEAVTIARSLGADPQWLALTERILSD